MRSNKAGKPGLPWWGRSIWAVAVVGAVAVVAVVGLARASSAGPSIPAFKLDSWRTEQTFAPAPKTPVIKPDHPTPPAEIAQTAPVWGLLPADAGPVPLPSRLYKVENKWLGEVNGAFTGVYAGADAQNPQVGILAVFQPSGGGAALRVYRTRTATGALRITQVSGRTVAFTHASGQGSFDLATRQFGR